MKHFMLIVACLSSVAMADELPPTLMLPTKVVTTETPSSTSTVTRTEVIDTIDIGVWYVIRSKTPLFVLDSPQGSVSIVSNPSSIDGIFAGGEGKPETRVFPADESTYLIQGLKPCKTELILVPVGVKDKTEIFRQKLTVSGTGPNPPPEPDPDPDVEPDPDPVPVKSFRVIFVKESGQTLNAAQTAIPAAKAIRAYLNLKTTQEGSVAGWREYDPQQVTDNEQPVMKALWEAVKPKLLPAPCMIIEVNGHATVMAFPSNVEECLTTLKKFGGE
jgi:hypothetical protein